MKKIELVRRVLLSIALSAIGMLGYSQTADDLLMFSVNDVQGTARYSGMGGAFNALGGDFGALSVNPAGIALYRRSEFSITPTISNTRTSTGYLGTEMRDSRVRFGLSNLGYVGNMTYNKTDGLVSISYGLGYNKLNDFHRSAPMQGFNSPTSIMDSYEETANSSFDYEFQDIIRKTPDRDLYRDQRFFPDQWTAVGAVATELLHNYKGTNNVDKYISVLDEGELVDQYRHSWQSGSTGEYVLSMGANISNKIYLGATIGMQDLRYENFVTFSEDGQRNLSAMELDVEEFFRTSGFGINGKFGVIFRPIDEFRLGFAVHTPTFYEMEESYSFNMTGNSSITNVIRTSSEFANIYNYRMQSPYRLEFGLAYTIKQVALLSVDYELVGYNGMRMRDNQFSSHSRGVNQNIRDDFRASSNVRVGVEGNLGNGLLLRGGFNFIQSPYSNTPGMRSWGLSNSDFNRYVYSAGFGYRSGSFFADFAYTINVGNTFFQPYFLEPVKGVTPRYDPTVTPLVPIAKEREQRSRFMLTFGFRF